MTKDIEPIKQNSELTTRERLAALKDQAANADETWQPEPGDSLVGTLVGQKLAVGLYGENYQMMIEDENGCITSAWLTPWLKENLKAQQAEIGDLIALTFIGKKESPAGRNYNAYSLIVDKT